MNMKHTLLYGTLACAAVMATATPKLSATTPLAKIFVVNTADSSISLVDLNTMKEVRRIPVGVRPYFVALSGDGKTLAVTVEGEDKIRFFDTRNFQPISEFHFGKMNADHLMTLPDGKHAVMADRERHALSFINFDTKSEDDRIEHVSSPHNIQIGNSGRFVYATSKTDPGISIVDIATHKVIKFFSVKLIPRGLAVSPDEKTIYFGANWVSGVFVLDPASGKVRLIMIDPPRGIKQLQESTYHSFWAVNDSIIIGANEGYSSLDIINVKSGKLVGRYENVAEPGAVVPLPNNPLWFTITNMGDNTVEVVELNEKTNKFISHGKVQVGNNVGNLPKRFAYWTE